jgi:hypothetical protein
VATARVYSLDKGSTDFWAASANPANVINACSALHDAAA